MAGNPFRRPQDVDSRHGDGSQLVEPIQQPERKKTPKKKVKIQTPPRSPEEPPRRLSAGRISPPPPKPPDDDDDSDSTTGESGLEEAARNTRRNSGSLPSLPTSTISGIEESSIRAPYNPFVRTLATSEHSLGETGSIEARPEKDKQDSENQHQPGTNRAHLDVDQFKNILLTGNAGPSSGPWQKYQDSSSNTDASSVSKQSLFDPSYEIHPGTPRSSIDQMESLESASDSSSDDESSSLMTGRDKLDDLAPQIPPKLSHGESTAVEHPQNVSFANFDTSIRSKVARPIESDAFDPSDPTTSDRPAEPQKIARDLHKPLPTSSRESSNANDTLLVQKKAAPPPPVARRKGLERDRSDPRLSSEQERAYVGEAAADRRSTDTSAKSTAPPPPPARKGRPVSQSAAPPAGISPPAASPPLPSAPEVKSVRPPPPPRSSSKRSSSTNLSPPTVSQASTPRNEVPSSSQNAPQAPPPRRSGVTSTRTSIDGRPPSIGERRRSSEYSGKASTERSTSPSNFEEVVEIQEPQQQVAGSSANLQNQPRQEDVLADMTAFQAEIDALRARASNRG